MENVANNVYNSLKESTAGIAKKIEECNALEEKAKSGRYSAQALQNEIYPQRDSLKREISGDTARALESAKAIVREYQEEMRKADRLNPADITDDVKLFTAGITLNAEDILGILERNQGNATMAQLALRYVKEHNIDMGENRMIYTGHTEEIQGGDNLIGIINTYGRWIDKKNAPEMLDKFFSIIND